MPKTKPTTSRVPRILVVEGLSGASRCVRLSGAEAITVRPTNLSEMDEALAGTFDGLLLTGGGDVDPRLYGEKPCKQVYGVSETRDYTEWSALDRAKELGVPVLGICRGAQLMTVHNGGKLRQHIGGHRGIDHLVFAEAGSKFRRTLGHEHGYFVSLHHQVVRRTGDGWRVAARARGGTIEAVESRDGRCLGVQFHPEMDYGHNEASRRIFTWLVNEAAKRAGMPKPKRMRAPAKKAYKPVPVPKRRAAGQRQLPVSTLPVRPRKAVDSTVHVSWFCPTCAMQFDDQQDREDHIYWFHGKPQITVTEPPPGHPDWMS